MNAQATGTKPLGDAQDPRMLVARWVFCGALRLESAAHLAGEGSERVDRALLRDARSGQPLLPGTTLAGALRSGLLDRLLGYGVPETDGLTLQPLPQAERVARLFGGSRGDDQGGQSPLVVFDALGQVPADRSIEVRDGVAIDPAWGTAEDGKKYDYEVLPAGTTFAVRLDLLVPSLAAEPPLLQSLVAALEVLSMGDTSLGARRSRGLGRVTAAWQVRRFDLTSRAGWRKFLATDPAAPLASVPTQGPPRLQPIGQAMTEALASCGLPKLKTLADQRSRVVIKVRMTMPELLIRDYGGAGGEDEGRQGADVVQLQSANRPVLPGTSLAGVLRAQALRIASLLKGDDGRGDDGGDGDVSEDKQGQRWVDRLFGPRFVGQRPLDGEHAPHASRLRVGEAVVEGGHRGRQTRVAIDRFTGGPSEGALFVEAPWVGGTAWPQIELRNPKPGELGLMLLVLKDLLDGSVPVGGTTGVGRGQVTHGSATVQWHHGSRAAKAILTPGKAPAGEAAHQVDEAIAEFLAAGPLEPPGSPAAARHEREGHRA